MSPFISAILAREMARKRGVSGDSLNKIMVTGYALGSATSPLLGAIVTDQLAQREAVVQPAATTSVVSTAPSSSGNSQQLPDNPNTTSNLPVPGVPGIRVDDFFGQPYQDAQQILSENKIEVRLQPVVDDKYGRNTVVDQRLLTSEGLKPLPAGMYVFPGDVVVLFVTVEGQKTEIPNVEGLLRAEARKELESKGFVYAEKEHDRANFTTEDLTKLKDKVLDQEPEARKRAVAGSTVTVQYALPPVQDSSGGGSGSVDVKSGSVDVKSGKGNPV